MKQSSYKWMEQLGIHSEDILDPDGWDRTNFRYSMSRAIIEKTFVSRLCVSTMRMTPTFIKLAEKYGR